jgi:HEAT repeat protein
VRVLLCLTLASMFWTQVSWTQSHSAGSSTPKIGEDARRDRVMQWAAKAGPNECGALTGALLDESFDIRNRAASALYWKCDRTLAVSFAPALCRTLELGNAEAGAVLLLGYTRPEDATACLKLAAQRREMVKLAVSAQPVPMTLAAHVALARLGDAAAVSELRQAFEKPDVPTALFLLGVLQDIVDPEALRAAVKLLDDDRPGPGVVAHATRTIRDIALEALVARLALIPSFALEPGRRYDSRELAEIRTAADRVLSAPPQSG